MRTTRVVAYFALLIPGTLAAQAGESAARWRWVNTADELSARTDSRLLLSATASGPILFFVCGNRLPGDSGRTLLFFTGESLFPYGGSGSAYMEVRFAGEKGWHPWYWLIYDAADPQVELPLTAMSRRVAFMGSQHNAYFSTEIFKRMLGSDTTSIRYQAFGDSHEVHFLTAGLAAMLKDRSDCKWLVQ
jgi:hypothetical protein